MDVKSEELEFILNVVSYYIDDLIVEVLEDNKSKPEHSAVYVSNLIKCNIKVMQESTAGPALTMNFDLRKDVRGVFMAKNETLLSLVNVHAVNEKGQSSVDIDRINHHVVNVENINFKLPERGR